MLPDAALKTRHNHHDRVAGVIETVISQPGLDMVSRQPKGS
jgi:hypothetical protein